LKKLHSAALMDSQV